jgi:hypothetical protein
MQILHFLIMPFMIFFFSVVLQLWLDSDEFTQFYKLVGLGILAGIIVRIISSFFAPLFAGRAHFVTVLLDSFLISGLLYSMLISAAFWFLLHFHIGHKLTLTWSMTAVSAMGFLGGVTTINNILDAMGGNYPNSPLFYTAYIPVLLIFAIVTGFGLPKFMDNYELWKKILWGVFCVALPAITMGAFEFLHFFNYAWVYLAAAVLVPVAVLFEMFDFKVFRQR